MSFTTLHLHPRTIFSTAAVLASIAVLTACGSSGSSSTKSADETQADSAVKFAQCMRGHGVDMPDPVNGQIQLKGGPGDRQKIDEGQQACQKYLKAGQDAVDPKVEAERRDHMVAYATCMRRNGVHVADPEPNGGMKITRGPGSDNADSALFERADAKCRSALGKGPGGGGEGPGTTKVTQ